MQSDYLVIVPAYNEEDTIGEVMRLASSHADVCVVDDGSTDDTYAIVRSRPEVHCLRHEQNTHIAGALLDGMRYGYEQGYTFCITMDAGLSHDPDALPLFQKETDADLVIGYRNQKVGVPLHRRALSWAGNSLMNLALSFPGPADRTRLRDITSGYRMYSRRAVQLLIDSPMRSRTFDFHLESLAYVYKAGLTIREVPIVYRYSNTSLKSSIVLDALKTWFHIWKIPNSAGGR